MLNFHQSLPFLNWLFPLLYFPQDFPARISHKIFLQQFPTRFFCKIFPQEFPGRFSCKIFPQDLPKLDPDWLASHHPIPNAKFPPITAFLKLAFSPPLFPTRFLPQEFPRRFSRKIFPQDFPKLDPDWLAPHHPIPNAKFPPITVFLKLAFSPPPFPARFSRKNFPEDFPARFSCKNFPQNFPARFSCKNFLQDFPELDPDWLAHHHLIPNAKFPPITALLNRPTYHKRSKVSPPPFPQILWEPKINV